MLHLRTAGTMVVNNSPDNIPQTSSFSLNWSAYYDTDDLTISNSTYTESLHYGSIDTTEIHSSVFWVPDDGALTIGHYDAQGPYLGISAFFGSAQSSGMSFQIRPLDGVLPTNFLSTPGRWTYSSTDDMSGSAYYVYPDGSGTRQVLLYPTDLILSVHAVPEPSTYAMLFAGLAMVSVAAYRRKAP